MHTIYLALGAFTFWFAVSAATGLAAVRVWETNWCQSNVKRRALNLWTWCRILTGGPVPVIGPDWHRMAIGMVRRTNQHPNDWWERNLVAYVIRYSRRNPRT